MTTPTKVLEPSKENEMMVLGCMLTSIYALETCYLSLSRDSFVFSEHRLIFDAIKSLQESGLPVDVHLICEDLKKKNNLQKSGGAAYIATLAQFAGTSAHIEWYCDFLIESAGKRELLNTIAQNTHKPLEEIQEILNRKLGAAVGKKTSSGALYQHLLDKLSEKSVVEEIRKTSPGMRVGITIGDTDLEIPGGAITIVATPTSHGKTAMLINQSLGLLKENHEKCIYSFSYEENMSAIVSLFLNTYIGKELSKNNRKSIESFFRTGSCEYMTEENREVFLSDKNAFFENLADTGRLNVYYTDMAAEQLVQAILFLNKNRDDIGAVFIDYMQLLRPLEVGRSSRQEQLKHICLILKDCAVQTGLPIVLAAQFSRQVTCEADLSPIYISEAGDIERIASMVLGFWNRNFQGFTSSGNRMKYQNAIAPKESKLFIEILKGRKTGAGQHGLLNFRGNEGKIDNLPSDFPSSFKEYHTVKITEDGLF